MAEKYGELDRKTWPDDIRKGLAECFRVLKPDGVLIFKWNETDILLREVSRTDTVPSAIRASIRQSVQDALGRLYEVRIHYQP